MRHFIFVVGPTASGKTDLALDLAEKNKGVIFNCDSIQLYQRVEIGSAKPTPEERKRVPHYLLDIVKPPDEITAGRYRDLFLEEIKKIPESTPIYVVGGTGFYFLTLEKGMFEIKKTSESLKAQIEKELTETNGTEKLYQEVKVRDPIHAEKLHLNDHYRIGRAVEILRSNPGRTITELFAEKKEAKGLDGKITKLGLKWDATDLAGRIVTRTKKMLQMGLVEETKALMDEGLENWAPLRSVGYKETVAFLKGEIPKEQLEEQIIIATRQLAKKQRTWFQRDPEIQWIQGSSPLAIS